MAPPTPRNRFRGLLCGISQTTSSREGVDDINRQLMESLLAFGSATDDNRRCVEHVRVGVLESNIGRRAGLMTVDNGLRLADIFNNLEDAEIPETVRRAFPSLSPAEWDACTRMVTLILIALEAEPERST